MTLQFFERSGWTSTPKPLPKLVGFDTSLLQGVAVHYTGSTSPFGNSPTLAQSSARLEAEREDHVNGRGWSDIAYNYAIDQVGRVFELRGYQYRSAANGDRARNDKYGAVTFLIGVGDNPTAAAVAAFQELRSTLWLSHWPKANAVIGHRDVYATDCPGDPLYSLVRSGTLAQPLHIAPAPTEDEVISPESLQAIVDKLLSDAPDGAYYKVRRPNGSLASLTVAVSEIYAMVAEMKAKIGA